MVRKGLRGDNKQRGGEIVGRERRLGLSTKFWNSLPWRPVDVDAAELGSFDDSVFHGLEEIDGNVFLSQKAAKEPQGEQEKEKETVTDTAAAADDKKAKKKKNKKRAREEETPSEEISSPAVVDVQQAVESGKKKKKKTKKDKKTERESAQENSNDNDEKDNDNNESNNNNDNNKDSKNKAKKEKKKQQKKDKKASTSTDNNAKKESVIDHDAMAQLLSERAVWGDLSLSAPLAAALQALDFSTPTPIQRQAVPAVGEGKCDVVGVAETGSGKTLAYLLPVLNALLLDWSSAHARQSPYALIIAPTREIAMQISNVLRDISLKLRAYTDAQGEGETQQQQQQQRPLDKLRIESATVVGGMSEEKQRRQLSTSDKKALHIIVATPGRLVEILEDETVESLRDLSTLRFLVVDEADRIMEEGHFAELHRVFSRIRDHEAIAATGRSVEEVLRERQRGIDVEEGPADEEEGEEDEELGEDDEEEGGVPGFERMPTEEELRIARETQPAVPYDEEEEGEEEGEDAGEEEEEEQELAEDDEEDEMMEEAIEEEEEDEENEEVPYESDDEHAQSAPAPHSARKQQPRSNKRSQKHKVEKQDLSSLQRQTLLFSATALQTLEKTERQQSRKQSKTKLHGTLKGLATGCSLPGSLKELLALVAVQGVIQVVDVTHDTHGAVLRESQSKEGGNKKEMLVALPKNLKQYEILCPTEDKDVYAYYFLYKNPGRTLVFVNSIKTARRVDGLLRALGFHSRALHAELAQRARLQALDSFRGSPQGILVATDVAARGLDIPQISAVLHYDVARSPQVYMHRSGRTARAHASGTAVSLVTPEDASHHEAICIHLSGQVKALDALPVEGQLLPPLRERVKLAKKIFTASFVVSQRSRERHWVQQSALEAELDLDDELREEMGGDEEQREKEAAAQAKLQKERAALKALLDIPVESLVGKMGGGAPAREKPFKHNKKSKKLALEQQMKQQDWRKRRNGFFVYTPPN